mmetsp:Transcript_18116/g.39284  ORF Transcript_18116/g.39284 Transcript_18116/m.39284 type:complete len:1006 (-) Transcript_18116:293-3310(-)
MDRYALRLPPLANHRLSMDNDQQLHGATRTLEQEQQVLASTVGDKVETIGKWRNPHNVVHVVHTRIMQGQADLVHLSRAHMALFKTFTLPSLRQQTNTNFLWIIWTDPELEECIKTEMMASIEGVSNSVVVLGAHARPHSDLRGLYGLFGEEELQQEDGLTDWIRKEVLVAGAAEPLVDYLQAAKTRLLIETNLDSDDALSKNYVESVQQQAVGAMGVQKVTKTIESHNQLAAAKEAARVEVLCPERHLEWRYYKPSDEGHLKGHLMQFLSGNENRDSCGIHSGTSTVYHVNATAGDLEGVKEMTLPICEETRPSSGEEQRTSERRLMSCRSRGVQQYEYIAGKSGPEHLEACPKGSYFCESSMHSSLGGPTFVVPSQIVKCNVMHQHRHGLFRSWRHDDSVNVEVAPIKYLPGTTHQGRFQVNVLGDKYMLAAIHLKSDHGSSLYTWNGDADSTGAVVSGVFSTPKERSLHHIDVCVIPRDKVCDAQISPQEDHDGHGSVESSNPASEAENHLVRSFPACQRRLHLLNQDTLAPTRNYLQTGVLLSRTPTASGVHNVLPSASTNDLHNIKTLIPEKTFESSQAQGHAWVILEHDFGVDQEEVLELRKDFEENIELILADAFRENCGDKDSPSCLQQRKLHALLRETTQGKLAEQVANSTSSAPKAHIQTRTTSKADIKTKLKVMLDTLERDATTVDQVPTNHRPHAFVNGSIISLTTKAEDSNVIEYMWIRDAGSNELLAAKAYSTADLAPTLVAIIPKESTSVIVLAYCSKHGVWRSENIQVSHKFNIPFWNKRKSQETKDDESAIEASEAVQESALPSERDITTPNTEELARNVENPVSLLDSKLLMIEKAHANKFNTDGSPELHHPMISVNRTFVEVGVPHPMDPKGPHFIEYIWLRDVNTSQLVAARAFHATDQMATMAASVRPGTTLVRAYAYCNKHGVWTSRLANVKHRKKISFYNRDHAEELERKTNERAISQPKKKIPFYNKIRSAEIADAAALGA